MSARCCECQISLPWVADEFEDSKCIECGGFWEGRLGPSWHSGEVEGVSEDGELIFDLDPDAGPTVSCGQCDCDMPLGDGPQFEVEATGGTIILALCDDCAEDAWGKLGKESEDFESDRPEPDEDWFMEGEHLDDWDKEWEKLDGYYSGKEVEFEGDRFFEDMARDDEHVRWAEEHEETAAEADESPFEELEGSVMDRESFGHGHDPDFEGGNCVLCDRWLDEEPSMYVMNVENKTEMFGMCSQCTEEAWEGMQEGRPQGYYDAEFDGLMDRQAAYDEQIERWTGTDDEGDDWDYLAYDFMPAREDEAEELLALYALLAENDVDESWLPGEDDEELLEALWRCGICGDFSEDPEEFILDDDSNIRLCEVCRDLLDLEFGEGDDVEEDDVEAMEEEGAWCGFCGDPIEGEALWITNDGTPMECCEECEDRMSRDDGFQGNSDDEEPYDEEF